MQINSPGRWDFFLSHHKAAATDQAANLSLRLRAAGHTVWYDNFMLDCSEDGMKEGVQNSLCFVLFLTGGTPSETRSLTPRVSPCILITVDWTKRC